MTLLRSQFTNHSYLCGSLCLCIISSHLFQAFLNSGDLLMYHAIQTDDSADASAVKVEQLPLNARFCRVKHGFITRQFGFRPASLNVNESDTVGLARAVSDDLIVSGTGSSTGDGTAGISDGIAAMDVDSAVTAGGSSGAAGAVPALARGGGRRKRRTRYKRTWKGGSRFVRFGNIAGRSGVLVVGTKPIW